MKNQIIANIKKGKKLKDTIPQYLQEMKILYQKYGLLQFIFAYYDFCEDRREKELLYTDDRKDMIEKLEDLIQETVDSFSKEKKETLQERFFQLREENGNQMGHLMEYVNRIELFEHILNHLQYKFDPPYEGEYERETIAQRLYEDIFHENDPVVIDGKIKCLIEQFPAPIVKTKFYDYVFQNIELYTGSDRKSFERMLSALRSTGCLNPLEERNEKQLFDIVKELETLDYRSMEKQKFEDTKQFVSQIALQLEKKSDILWLYQRVLNALGAVLLCETEVPSYEEEYKILTLLLESKEDFEKLRQAESMFSTLEGKQEELVYEIDMVSSYLEELPRIERRNQKMLGEMELEKKRVALLSAGVLLSDHFFAPLEEQEDEKVTEEEAKKEAEQLKEEWKQFFKTHSRVVNQSVMARVLALLPSVYKSQREVAQHIEYAMIQSNSKEQVMANFELYQFIQKKF